MKYTIKALLFSCLALLALASCNKEYATIQVEDDQNIQSYIKRNSLTGMQKFDTTGIYYQIIAPGTGTEMQYSEQVPLIFSIKTLDGSYNATDTIINHYGNYLGYFSIKGVRDGVKLILKNRGGIIRLLIPSNLAYGRNGQGSISGNQSLDITVHALDASGLDAYEDYTIRKYLEANNLTGFSKTSTGIYYKIKNEGTGSSITADSLISASYIGKFLNGKYFNGDETVAATLGSETLESFAADSWKQIIPLIKEGGTVRFISPSKFGYGLTGSSDGAIPAFSCLDFEANVTDVSSQ